MYFEAAVNAPFMDEMAAVGRGRSDAHNAEDALRLIQHWGRQFESKKAKFPIFFETFIRLRATNLRYSNHRKRNNNIAFFSYLFIHFQIST